MRTIPQTFTTRGFVHTLLERSENVAIYSQEHRATGRIMAFEVLRVRKATKEGVHPHSAVPTLIGDETLPSESQWGKNGFTVPSLDAARTKAAQLHAEAQQKPRKTRI